MNDKWFNMAMIIVLTSLVANGFVFMLIAIPGGSQFTSLYQANLSYSLTPNVDTNSVNYQYNPKIADQQVIAPGASDTTGTGFTPITTVTNDPFGLAPLTLVATAFVGLEVLLLSLANIFPMFSVMFILFALLAFVVKAIVVAYFASILIRSIFGGRI
jgi:hypothetical protein